MVRVEGWFVEPMPRGQLRPEGDILENVTSPVSWIVYVDLDAYYVSCEVRDRPDLVGKEVIVGPPPTAGPTRGVVLSASYEARRHGVKSAMPATAAARLAPEAVWLPPDFPKYERVAQQVRELLRRFSPDVVPLSIDEAAVGLGSVSAGAARSVAEEIQRTLRKELDLPASLGVATSRVVAKIATDRAKPGGILVVLPGEVAAFLEPLPVRAIPGVGPKTEAILGALEVRTIGELARRRPRDLERALGSFARELVSLARGAPTDRHEVDPGPRARSTDRTFPRDVTTWEEIEPAVRKMASDLAQSLEKEELRYATVGVAFRWGDFTRSQRSRALGAAREGIGPLTMAALRLARELWEAERSSRGRPIRTLSVKTEHLSERRQKQVSLDDFPQPPPAAAAARSRRPDLQ
ncbi:MAG: DNA polymerase IV [Thermoplasmata archaeon]